MREISAVLAIAARTVALRFAGRMHVNSLAKRVERGDVGTVSQLWHYGNRSGDDRLPEILALGEKHRFRVHADAATAAISCSRENLEKDAALALARIGGNGLDCN